MVDEMKKQMRRFEHIIGYKGKLDVTSRNSMKELINALSSRYKKDIQSSLRLHRLEFFYDLVQSSLHKKQKSKGETGTDQKKGERAKANGKEQLQEEPQAVEGVMMEVDDILTVEPKDIDDWKDLMTLSKIYYVLEHPRSVGLTWKRRIAKKKKIEKFGDIDLIEWRVAQNFRLRGLEEWAQRRSDARKMAKQSGYELENLEDSQESRELEELFQIFDPSKRSYKSKKGDDKQSRTPNKPPPDRPFKYQDESMEDWTESYSEDSEYSGAEDFVEEIEDYPDVTDHELEEFQVTKKPSFDEEDLSEILSGYREFFQYKNPIFEQMDEAQTLQKWYELYDKSCPAFVEEKAADKSKLGEIAEEEEEEEDEVESEKGELGEAKPVEEETKKTAAEAEFPTDEQQLQEISEEAETDGTSDQEIERVSVVTDDDQQEAEAEKRELSEIKSTEEETEKITVETEIPTDEQQLQEISEETETDEDKILESEESSVEADSKTEDSSVADTLSDKDAESSAAETEEPPSQSSDANEEEEPTSTEDE